MFKFAWRDLLNSGIIVGFVLGLISVYIAANMHPFEIEPILIPILLSESCLGIGVFQTIMFGFKGTNVDLYHLINNKVGFVKFQNWISTCLVAIYLLVIIGLITFDPIVICLIFATPTTFIAFAAASLLQLKSVHKNRF